MDPMKLQKLLYYAQGWYLAETGQPLFHEMLEAWRYGPVVPKVYNKFRHFGKKPIDVQPESSELSGKEVDLVEAVWARYGGVDGITLSERSHLEAPWRKAREGLSPDSSSNRQIAFSDLMEEFRQQEQDAESGLSAIFEKLCEIGEENARELTGRDHI